MIWTSRSAAARPASSEDRGVGSDRSRSVNPEPVSWARPAALVKPRKIRSCTIMAGTM
ncbi:MAG TPA: hypothetical protein VHY31_13770 [Streptosporangiaceae bacterium]|nr:hypothetical protein [Streptosporangiaceae bacterium]